MTSRIWIGRWQRLVAALFGALVRLEERMIRRTRNGRRTFFETNEFPWVPLVEENWRAVRRELESVLKGLELIPNFQDIQIEQRPYTTDDRWKTFFFCGYGAKHQKNLERCPATARLLSSIPGLITAFFSILGPGKRLPRHRGPYRGVLRYHLALKVPELPERCGIRVGEDVAHWQEGRSLIFDDTHPHEAWNDTDETRVVLFVDFVRPLSGFPAMLNRFLLTRLSRTGFVQNAVRRLERWEEMFGEEFDRVRRGPPADGGLEWQRGPTVSGRGEVA